MLGGRGRGGQAYEGRGWYNRYWGFQGSIVRTSEHAGDAGQLEGRANSSVHFSMAGVKGFPVHDVETGGWMVGS